MRPGDVLTMTTGEALTLDGRVRVIRIVELADRRGPAEAARRLYEEIASSSPERADLTVSPERADLTVLSAPVRR